MTYAGNDIIGEIETSEEYKTTHGEHKKLDIKQYAPSRAILLRACRKLIADVNDTLRYYTAQSQSRDVFPFSSVFMRNPLNSTSFSYESRNE